MILPTSSPGHLRESSRVQVENASGEAAPADGPLSPAGANTIDGRPLSRGGRFVDRGHDDESFRRRREYRRILIATRDAGVSDADIAVVVVRIGATDPDELRAAFDAYVLDLFEHER